jgi:hypothetical protein
MQSRPYPGGAWRWMNYSQTDTPTFGRYYTEIPVEQMTVEQKSSYWLLSEGSRGRLPGPYRV